MVCYTMFARTHTRTFTYILGFGFGQRTKNQIDHIMLSNRFGRSVIDARTYRCADITSNHIFLLAIIKLKLRAMRKVQGRRKLR